LAYWFWVFLFYSLAGCFLERAYAHRTTGEEHPVRRCLLFLPLCPVYGLGVMAVLALPASMRQGIWLPVAGAAATTLVEYLYHWACEALLGVKFWDYSGVSGNLQGRVCIPFSLVWGGLISLVIWFIQPPLETLIARIPPIATYLMLLVFTADAVCSLRFLAVTHSVAALRGEV
jgi:uncharacterized membrane protein